MFRSTDIPLQYVECDIRDGATLVEWRRERVEAARAERREREASRESLATALKRRLPRLRPRPAYRPRFA